MKLRPGAAIFLVSVAILIGYAVAPAPADAALVINLNFEFSGATQPCGTAPWLTATFANQAVNTVRLTMQGNLQCAGEFVRFWYFNLDPTMDPTQLTFTKVAAGFTAPDASWNTGTNEFRADGDGFFDIRATFPLAPPGSRFTGTQTAIYDISGITGLNENSFDFPSASGGGAGTYRSAAHVQGIGPGGDDSGWIGDKNGNGTTEEVPEPSTALLLGTALLGVIGVGRRVMPKS